MEVEIAAENLVGPFAAQHHLDAHRLDDAGQQIHRRGGPDGGHVVGFDIVDDIAEGIQPFLNSIIDFMVNRSDMFGHQTGLFQVGSPLQPYGEGMQLRHHHRKPSSLS